MKTQHLGLDRKIILVEDEPEIRLVFERMLQSIGCSVITAQNGQEAIQKIQADQDIRLMITDINMPVMDGRELLRRVKEIKPALKAIVLSASIDFKEKLPANEVLQKPIGFADFTRVVSRYLVTA